MVVKIGCTPGRCPRRHNGGVADVVERQRCLNRCDVGVTGEVSSRGSCGRVLRGVVKHSAVIAFLDHSVRTARA